MDTQTTEVKMTPEDYSKIESMQILVHDLRTSLTALKWTLDMFLSGDLGPLTDEQRKYVTKALEANDHLISQVSTVLALSKGEGVSLGDAETLTLSSQNIIQLVDLTLFELGDEAFKHNVLLSFAHPEPIFMVDIDVDKVRFVIKNLIENAIKYSSAGGKVIVEAILSDAAFTLSVHDDGIGIPVEEQSQIFTKYYRATNARAKAQEGTGIGLFASKRIIEAHGGTFTFESKPQMGTTFVFTLPLHAKANS